jgi:hypothetical protein
LVIYASERSAQLPKVLLMPPNPPPEPTLNEEIQRLEAEITRVAALSITSDAERVDLAARLQRLKKLAGMK